jgi:hypothetical protein
VRFLEPIDLAGLGDLRGLHYAAGVGRGEPPDARERRSQRHVCLRRRRAPRPRQGHGGRRDDVLRRELLRVQQQRGDQLLLRGQHASCHEARQHRLLLAE